MLSSSKLFSSVSTSGARNLPEQVATAVAYGLPYQEGLKALTLNAAEIGMFAVLLLLALALFAGTSIGSSP